VWEIRERRRDRVCRIEKERKEEKKKQINIVCETEEK
jgi:hypothetical protein